MKALAGLALLLFLLSACAVPAIPPFTAAVPSTTVPPPTPSATAPLFPSPLPTAASVASPTPPGTALPQPIALCPILATRTPPPNAATVVPGGPNPSRGVIDPHVELCASAAAVHVGETLTLTARVVDIGLPYFRLNLTDADPSGVAINVQVTYDNQLKGTAKQSRLFELVSAKGGMLEAAFVLHALRSGAATVVVGADGEIHYGYPGPATWGGGRSDPARVEVVE